MRRVLIIDDESTQKRNLKEYLKREAGIDENDILAPACDRTNSNHQPYSANEQYARAKKILSENWETSDIILIDIYLLGLSTTTDENPMVSQRIFEDMLKEKSEFKNEITSGKKIVIFITGKGSSPRIFKNNINEIAPGYWHEAPKPDRNESFRILNRADCKTPWCRDLDLSMDDISTMGCRTYDCLKNLIVKFKKDGSGPIYDGQQL
ncbi:MAG: hypothetical protein FWH52_00990 [Synergistaceae bacterium]|nr:hypothetical protein [Synergistaceae bacterium]